MVGVTKVWLAPGLGYYAYTLYTYDWAWESRFWLSDQAKIIWTAGQVVMAIFSRSKGDTRTTVRGGSRIPGRGLFL